MRRVKIIALCMTVILSLSALAGCKGASPNEAVFKIGKETCSMTEAKILLVNYQNQYRDVYGVDLWKATGDENQELESYIKDLTISQLAEIYMMSYIGKDQELELSEEELADIETAAAAYYNSLNDTEKEYFGASEKDIANLYEHYAMARKVFSALTENVEQEVSDDEARVMSVMQIYASTEDYANMAYNKLQGGTDFSAVAAAYNQAESTSLTVDRADVPTEAEEAVFGLSNGEYTSVIGAEDGFYIYYCVNNYEEELTQENKEAVLAQRMEDAVNTTYDTYTASTDSKLYTDRWDKVSVNTDEALSTMSFFDVFEEHCGENY